MPASSSSKLLYVHKDRTDYWGGGGALDVHLSSTEISLYLFIRLIHTNHPKLRTHCFCWSVSAVCRLRQFFCILPNEPVKRRDREFLYTQEVVQLLHQLSFGEEAATFKELERFLHQGISVSKQKLGKNGINFLKI